MNAIHHSGILHNDLSKDNTMLHFPVDKLGMCDWGEVGRLQEVTPSLYGFAKEQNATNAKNIHWWVALELFIVYSELGIAISFQQIAKQHTITLTSKAYLMGKLANIIWGDDWDVEYFVDNSTKMSLEN
jgi:hypothetical protein